MSEEIKPCETKEARQFDFWIGDWDLTWADGGKGSNKIRATYGGCVIEERFDGRPSMDFSGMSISQYNPKLEKWKQTWMDDAGTTIDLVGVFENNMMILISEQQTEKGLVLFRMKFHHIEADSFDWDWERSADAGETWEPSWQIHYERKKT